MSKLKNYSNEYKQFSIEYKDAFLWADPDQDFWFEITGIMLHSNSKKKQKLVYY